MIEIPFIGQAYELPSLNAAFQRSLNWYEEAVPGETKGKVILNYVCHDGCSQKPAHTYLC